MNFKVLLSTVLLAVACASKVSAVDSTAICQNAQGNEQTRALCQQIEQLKAQVSQSNMKTADKASVLAAINSYILQPLSIVSSTFPVVIPVAVIGYIAYKLHVLGYVVAVGCGAAVATVVASVVVVGGIITTYLSWLNKHY